MESSLVFLLLQGPGVGWYVADARRSPRQEFCIAQESNQSALALPIGMQQH